jgi:hypothetical protein
MSSSPQPRSPQKVCFEVDEVDARAGELLKRGYRRDERIAFAAKRMGELRPANRRSRCSWGRATFSTVVPGRAGIPNRNATTFTLHFGLQVANGAANRICAKKCPRCEGVAKSTQNTRLIKITVRQYRDRSVVDVFQHR